MCCLTAIVTGVAQLNGVVYIACIKPPVIRRFNATTHERLGDIDIKNIKQQTDIVVCEKTSRLYFSDDYWFVWRLSPGGTGFGRFVRFRYWPFSLSVRSGRLLASYPYKLEQIDADGKTLRRVRLFRFTMMPVHAVESPTGTFVVSQSVHISEVDTGGTVRTTACREHE